jgi:hypothetical protein
VTYQEDRADNRWAPWSNGGTATRVDPETIVGAFPIRADYAAEGWRCTTIEVDETGTFVTATFRRAKREEQEQ